MKLTDLSLLQKGLLIIGIPLTFQLVFAVVITGTLTQSFKDASVARWRRESAERSDDMFRLCVEAATTVIAYGMTKDRALGLRYDQITGEIKDCRSGLAKIAEGNASSQKLLKQANTTIDYAMEWLGKIKKEVDSGASNPLRFMSLYKRQAVLTKLVVQLREVQKSAATNEYEQEQRDRRKHEREHALVLASLAIAAAGNIMVALGMSMFMTRQISNRLLLISENSKRLTEGAPLHAKQGGSDEVALLDHRFHSMVDALEAAAVREQEIINNSEDVICALAENRTFLFVNEAANRQWSIAPSQLIGRKADEIVHPDDLTKLTEFLSRVRVAPLPTTSSVPVSIRLRAHASADFKEYSWSCHWSELDARYFCVVHDISVQKEQERMKARFVNIIGANLNLPLQRIKHQLGELQEIARSEISARGQAALRNGVNASSRIVQLVDELLELEKMEGGTLNLQTSSSTIHEAFNSARDSVQSFAEHKKLQLNFSPCETLVNIDGKRLTQVLVNLLSNAIKYSPENGKINVNAIETETALCIEVLDEGPGIPEEALSKLFGRFARLDREVDRQTSGTGLGLAICKVIVEQHSGSIGAENHPSGGSRFWLSIPRSDKLALISTGQDSSQIAEQGPTEESSQRPISTDA